MQDPTPLDPPEQELEAALASLALSSAGINPDAMWYRAGLLRERRRTNRWRAAAAVALLAAGAAVFWRPKPGTVTVDRVVLVRESENPTAAPSAPLVRAAPSDADFDREAYASAGYLPLRDALVRNGPESLPATAAGDVDEAAVLRAGSMSPSLSSSLSTPSSAEGAGG